MFNSSRLGRASLLGRTALLDLFAAAMGSMPSTGTPAPIENGIRQQAPSRSSIRRRATDVGWGGSMAYAGHAGRSGKVAHDKRRAVKTKNRAKHRAACC